MEWQNNCKSNKTIGVEGNHYFPIESLNKENAAWYYPDPSQIAMPIKGYVAFWRDVDVEQEEVQGMAEVA